MNAVEQTTIDGSSVYLCTGCGKQTPATGACCEGSWPARVGSAAANATAARQRCRFYDRDSGTYPCPTIHDDHESLLCATHRGEAPGQMGLF